MSWYVGDRVRLGSTRGGIVIAHVGKLRVQFPDGSLNWLDHCVPDEGPDGKIYPNGYALCVECDNPTTGTAGQPFCVNCTARHDRETVWRPVASPPTIDPPAPSIDVHLVSDDGATCAQCGADLRVPSRGLGPTYKPGDFIARGHGWQAISFAANTATCKKA